ncbi:probable RNA-directed DNA polymerase from transposon X-element [Trichonephila clavipes]|nr:probable RNA-directed DNA polymerase from transposon X-element [Trichonephila clavipes]
MLKTSDETRETREHMKVITTAFPNIRSKLSGELIKLYTNTSIEYHKLLNLLDQHRYQYHVITPKDERPIKVVIKGLPGNTDINDIKSDLIDQGFTETKVSQLIGRITKQKLPVFMITLPRNIQNAKIFQLKTLGYLSIRIEGYEGTGVTQCYKCNRFNHTSDNCRMNPRCLKCGEAHQTKDCPIQRTETAYCINCQAYGHMANYSKCPLFPKPRKGTTTRNNYSTVVDSITLKELKIPLCSKKRSIFFTTAVRSAHQFASKPIVNTNHAFTPNFIRNLIRDKNRAKKLYHNTLNPTHKQNYYRLQEKLKKELKKISQQNWNNKLESLNTRDNSLWRCQKFLRNKRSNIPSLSSSSGVANSDEQKANILAITLKDNFSENKRPGDSNHPIDNGITNTLENFFDNHPSIPISPTDPDEILNYIKTLKNNKASGSDLITNKMIKNFPLKIILILTYLINKIFFLRHFPNNWKNAIVFPIRKPNKNAHNPESYRPISLLSILSKITEYVILNRLKTFTNDINFINPNQYGFTRNLSTYHPLLGLTEKNHCWISERQIHRSCLSRHSEGF